MRALLGLLVTAAIALGVLWFGLPVVANGAITGATVAAGLDPATTSVRVEADPPLAILLGHADRVVVHSSNDTLRGIRIASLDLTLGDVALLGRSARVVDGTLTGLQGASDGTALRIDRAMLAGDATAARLTLLVTADDVATALRARLTSAGGGTVGRVVPRPPNAVAALIDGRDVPFTLAVESDGSLVARPPGGILGPVVLWAPGPGLPASLDGVSVEAGGVVVTGTLDAAVLLGLTPAATPAP